MNEFTRKPIVEAFDDIELRFHARIEEREVMRGLFRMAVPTYDTVGFREALVNAIVHRDYSRLGTVVVRLDDRGLIVSNPGGFVEGVTLDNFLTVEPRPRNPLLADIAKRIGLAERTGRGIDRIFEGTLRFGEAVKEFVRRNAIRADERYVFRLRLGKGAAVEKAVGHRQAVGRKDSEVRRGRGGAHHRRK